MDNNYDQRPDADFYQQNNSYQQGIFYQQKAPNIFQQFILSFMPSQYNGLVKVKTGSMIGFVTLLVFIATAVLVGRLMFDLSSNGGTDWMRELPEFEISNGRFYIEENYEYAKSRAYYIYLTDDISGFTYSDASAIVAEGYQNILLVGRDTLSLMWNGKYQQRSLEDLGDTEINRDRLLETIMPVAMASAAIVGIVSFVGRTFWYFLCAAVYFLFALIIAQILKKQQPAGVLFRVAVYSKVLMFVVAGLFELISTMGISMPMSFSFRIVVTIAFMGFAIAKLPDKN